MRLFPRQSLRRRLVWQLLALQAGILLLLIIALTALIIRTDLGGMLIDPVTVNIVTDAVTRDGDGRLVLKDSEELRELREGAPEFWFILRSDHGEVLQDGPVPDAYRSLGAHLDTINFADIRDSAAPYALSAVARRTESSFGAFNILTGGGRLVSLTIVLLFLSNFLFLPIIALLVLIGVIAVPWIVGRAFKGVSALTGEAERIDIERRGCRLPDNDVPSEVRPLVHAVNDALERLDQGYERHRRFILDAAHELRTPVSILQTRIEAMAPDPMRTRLLADAGRMAALAEQLLDLQRLDNKTDTFTRVDLVALCERVAAELAPLAIASGYELSLDAEERPITVVADAGALERAVVNLVQNAIEHSGRQGGINIRAEKGGVIEVSDDGPGVPRAEREQIFEPFYRLTPRDRGAGLGLNLVKEVMRRHGGYVTVLDSQTGGACFRLHIPADHG